MEVDTIDLLQLGDFAQVVVVGIELRAEVARQADEFGIHFGLFREITVVDFDLVARVALDAVEHLQAAAAAGARDGVVGIGDLLQLLQDKAGHNHQAFDKISLDQVGDAAINDDAGIE